ncbi:RAVE subunit 2/Rogdi [Durotheca rogersii]|uniref:RAVE subunit 2/Rogdi n=1 Tax=Durotheca rogersii TaxID=419775 RepID=UPI002220E923|nr:RAVE subunit 2/Rogdi [Durotheca rogersii]KAI5867508.1 RAVE subunit 2/Rogdi [Durotheca rogersii]
MSVEIWPPIPPDELKVQEDATQDRELSWLLASLRATLAQLRLGLQDCCALLAPTEPGSTLALTTPRHETVKGHATRVGTCLVRGLIHLRLRTLPPQTFALDPARPVRIAALARLDALLARAVALCLAIEGGGGREQEPSAPHLASQLSLLADLIAEASAAVKGSPSPRPDSGSSSSSSSHSTRLGTASSSLPSERQHHHRQLQDHQQHNPPQKTDAAAPPWTTSSVAPCHFSPPLGRNLSLFATIHDASLVLYLRALEPADAPVNLGTKLALAIGTARRLDHDEADRVFAYRCGDDDDDDAAASSSSFSSLPSSRDPDPDVSGTRRAPPPGRASRESIVAATSATSTAPAPAAGAAAARPQGHDVYVREKVCVESADPSLLSLSAKLGALAGTLALARRNLAAVMGDAASARD